MTLEDDEGPACPHCSTTALMVNSEGAPCGVDGCYIFTCCDKAWEEHCQKYHPAYYAANFPQKDDPKGEINE